MLICMYVHLDKFTCIYMYKCEFTQMHSHMHTFTYMFRCIHIHSHACSHLHNLYTCAANQRHLHTCIHSHTISDEYTGACIHSCTLKFKHVRYTVYMHVYRCISKGIRECDILRLGHSICPSSSCLPVLLHSFHLCLILALK